MVDTRLIVMLVVTLFFMKEKGGLTVESTDGNLKIQHKIFLFWVDDFQV